MPTTVWQVEAGTAHGRGFSGADANGVLAKFLSWVKRPAADGSSQTFTVDAGTDLCSATGHGYTTGDSVKLTTTTTLPGGLSTGTEYYVHVESADTFYLCTTYANAIAGTYIDITSTGTGTHSIYALGGGPGWFLHDDQSSAGSNPYIVVCDVSAPAVNAMNTSPDGLPPKFIKVGKVDSEAGYIRVQHYLWWDNSTHTGRGLWCGHRIPTYDDADFEYRFRGGYAGCIIHTRLASTWSLGGILSWQGDANLVEGTDKYGILQSGVTAGASVVCQLDTGEAANFTLNKHYYIFDFVGHSWVNYAKCTNVDLVNDQITLASATTAGGVGQNFPAGSVVCAYAHRFFGFGSQHDNDISDINGSDYGAFANGAYGKIPYQSANNNSYVHHDQSGEIVGAVYGSILSNPLTAMNNDDDGYQAVMRPVLTELYPDNTASTSPSMNRAYGQVKELYACRDNSYLSGSDGKIINGLNYLKFGTGSALFYSGTFDSNYAALFLDSESTT